MRWANQQKYGTFLLNPESGTMENSSAQDTLNKHKNGCYNDKNPEGMYLFTNHLSSIYKLTNKNK